MLRLIIMNHTFAFLLPLCLGLFVFIKGSKRKINQIYFLVCIFIAGYSLGNLLVYVGLCDPKFGYRLAILFASLQAPALLLLSWFFPKRNPNITLKHITFICMISLFFSAFSFTNYYLKELKFIGELNMITSFGVLYYVFTIYFLSFAVASAINFLKSYFTTDSSMEKVRMRYFLVGLFVAYAIGITFSLVLSVLGSEKYEYLGPIGPNIFVIFSTYSIIKHRFMDIKVIIRKSLIYSVLIAASTGLYLFLVLALGQSMQSLFGFNSLLIGGLTIFLFVFAFQPLKNKVQVIIDKTFFKSKYEYQNTLKHLSQTVVSVIDLDNLLGQITNKVLTVMQLETASIMMLNKEANGYKLKDIQQKKQKIMLIEVKADSPLILHLKKGKKAIVREEVSHEVEAMGHCELAAVKEELENLGVALCIPLFSENKLIGLFNLGNKLSQDMYTDEDIDLLTTLSNQMAIAIENATLHEEMLGAQKQLLMADKLSSMGKVAAGLAHEIKNPLTAIKGMTQALERNPGDQETIKDFNAIIPKEVDRLTRLVEGLSNLGKTPKFQITKVNINQLLENNLKLFESRCRKQKINIVKEFGTILEIETDGERLTQVFTNLILNAIQAMPDGGELKISTRQQTNQLTIDISDTGQGIPENKLKDIFEPFFTTKEEGTGLGLAITHKIIKDLGGEIRVESVINKGTKFRIELPVN